MGGGHFPITAPALGTSTRRVVCPLAVLVSSLPSVILDETLAEAFICDRIGWFLDAMAAAARRPASLPVVHTTYAAIPKPSTSGPAVPDLRPPVLVV
jgi:hypothetical protein